MHLTSQQISEWILGDRSEEAKIHLRACSLCQAELKQFEDSLKEFRSSVRQWSESQLPVAPASVKRNPARPWIMGLSWAMAVLALCLGVERFYNHPVAQPKVAVVTATDADLLAQIDHEVSRTVADPMEPLTQLVHWDVSASISHDNNDSPKGQAQ